MVIELSPIRVINKLRGSLIWFSLYNQELQSQTNIVGALRPNAVFFLLVLPLSFSKLFIAAQSPNLVHQHWGDKDTQKCPNNFEWDCSMIPDQTVRLEVLLTISKSLLWQNLWYFELFQKQKRRSFDCFLPEVKSARAMERTVLLHFFFIKTAMIKQ